MGKGKKGNKVAQVAQPTQVTAAVVAPVTAPQLFSVVAPKRPLTGIKFGAAGNAATHAALYAAQQANKGPLTSAAVKAVLVEQKHTSFYGYAINRLKVLVPVTPTA